MLTAVIVAAVVLVAVSLPWWLPGRVIALREWVFARINGDEGIPVPGDLIGVDRFRDVYSHPAANGRSRGAALSDLFWYWLAPGPEMHQEHLEAGDRYDAVARTTRGLLSITRTRAEELTRACVTRGIQGKRGVVRLRDLMMPIWAEFAYELVFGERCPPHARDLIAANADDVVTSLKCCGLRHMSRRDRLTAYLLTRLPDVRQPLPEELTDRERALYLQGAFFNTAVVQMSEAMAHLLMVLAQHPEEQARAADGRRLDQVIQETLRLYPLFGIAHRITTGDIVLPGGEDGGEPTTIPAGSVLCFNYPEFHRAGHPDPDRFDPDRFAPAHSTPDRTPARELNHIPFGVAANRPCPAWRLAPIAMRVAAQEIVRAYRLDSTASHTRSMPNRGPCLLTPRDEAETETGPGRRATLLFMRFRDRWEDVGRSLVQLVLGTYMVWDARRLRLCERHFAGEGSPLAAGHE